MLLIKELKLFSVIPSEDIFSYHMALCDKYFKSIHRKNEFLLTFLCRLRSIAEHRDHFVRRLLCVFLSVRYSHTFLLVMHSYVSQATHAFLGMLSLCLTIILRTRNGCFNMYLKHYVFTNLTHERNF